MSGGTDNFIGDLVSITASIVAFVYVFGIWRIVKAKSRLILLIAVGYMVVTRVAILISEADTKIGWIESHRSLIIIPTYILLAVAFAMTYYELKSFRFDIPQSAEDLDTEKRHLLFMKSQSVAQPKEKK